MWVYTNFKNSIVKKWLVYNRLSAPSYIKKKKALFVLKETQKLEKLYSKPFDKTGSNVG